MTLFLLRIFVELRKNPEVRRSLGRVRARLRPVGLSWALIAQLALCGYPQPSYAQSAVSVSGEVFDQAGHIQAGAMVTLSGKHGEVNTVTGIAGSFSFASLAPGQYHVHAYALHQQGDSDVTLGAQALSLRLVMTPLHEIAHVQATGQALSRRSATDVQIDETQIAHAASGGNLPNLLIQLPSAARGSNGQIHINGDHNGLQYNVDGVTLPASLNRVLGNEIDPSTFRSLNVVEGAYPAQYGDHFAAALNITTNQHAGQTGGGYSVKVGSYGSVDTTVDEHVTLEHGATVSLGVHNGISNRGIDPPVVQFSHDGASDTAQFLRLSQPLHGQDSLNVDILHSNQNFQIPPDTANGVPATTDDEEHQDDTFASLQYHHDINGHGTLDFGPSLKLSKIIDANDLQNDLAGGNGSTCTDFSDCQFFSAYANRFARDYRFNADYVLRSDHHEIRSGLVYGVTDVDKRYDITLQPSSALNPSGPYTVSDTTPNNAHQQEAYLQDHWQMGKRYAFDYGLRMDAFQVRSSQFNQGFSQLSPRLKATRIFTPRANLYAYYGRLFEPFSFENVSPQTAAALYTPANNPGQTFDLKPERDSLYELGGQIPLGTGELGLRISHKVAADYLDDTQVGATNIHQDINFPRGRIDLQSLRFQRPLANKGKAYVSLTHSMALNSAVCETQLLQNCAAGGAQPGGDLVQADHDQRWDMNGGIVLNDQHDGWLSLDMEYGSGLSANPSTCPTQSAVNCKVPPHLIFNAEKGLSVAQNATLSLAMHNLLNDHYALTIDSSLQGTHYAEPRTLYAEYRYRSF